MKVSSFLIVAAVMFPLSVAFGDKSTDKQSFDKLDKNKDGYISQQEAKKDRDLMEKWDSADSDANGKLEMSEFSAFESGRASTYEPAVDPDDPSLGAAPMK